jgi:hypothetical protein
MARLSLDAVGLPARRRTLELASRVSWQLERGYLPSVDDYQARKRIHGRGQNSGHADTGRIHRIDISQSLIKRRIRYRNDSIAPRRKVMVVVDLSMCDGSRSARRLLGTALLVSLSLCLLKSTSIVLKGTGGTRPFRDQSFGSASEIGLLLDTLGDFERGAAGRLTAGKLRFDLGDTTAWSYFLISHSIDPEILLELSCPLGMTCVMVEPTVGRIPGSETGLVGGRYGGTSAMLMGAEFDLIARAMTAASRGRLGPVLRVRSDRDLASSFFSGVNEGHAGRARTEDETSRRGWRWPFRSEV